MQVEGVAGARYRSFKTEAEAQEAFSKHPDVYKEKKNPENRLEDILSVPEIIRESICVDAAWNSVSKVMEYRGVFTLTGEIIFQKGPYEDATNNIGEFLALVHALSWLKLKGLDMAVYSDSRTAISWLRKGVANTKLARTAKNAVIFDLLERAEIWIKKNPVPRKVYKWETEKWGEIPADFGRK